MFKRFAMFMAVLRFINFLYPQKSANVGLSAAEAVFLEIPVFFTASAYRAGVTGKVRRMGRIGQLKDNILGPGAIEWLGVHYKSILSSADTGGAMSITDSVSPPHSGPPRHVHKDADETFVILSGECVFWMDGEMFLRGPGETAFIPRGTEHTFQVIGDKPCRHLVILTPGGFEGFFAEMAEGQYRIPDDLGTISEIGARFEMEFTGPPIDPSDAEAVR